MRYILILSLLLSATFSQGQQTTIGIGNIKGLSFLGTGLAGQVAVGVDPQGNYIYAPPPASEVDQLSDRLNKFMAGTLSHVCALEAKVSDLQVFAGNNMGAYNSLEIDRINKSLDSLREDVQALQWLEKGGTEFYARMLGKLFQQNKDQQKQIDSLFNLLKGGWGTITPGTFYPGNIILPYINCGWWDDRHLYTLDSIVSLPTERLYGSTVSDSIGISTSPTFSSVQLDSLFTQSFIPAKNKKKRKK